MIKRKTLITILAMLLCLCLSAISVQAQEMKKEQGTIPSPASVVSLDRPVFKKVVPGSFDTIKLYWEPVENATGYEVYRKEGEHYVKVAQTTTTWYLLRSTAAHPIIPGVTYRFTVKAYNISGGVVTRGLGAYPTMTAKTSLGTVENITASAASTGNQIKLSWTAVPGATEHRIYRKNSAGSWVYVDKTYGSVNTYTHKSSTKFPIAPGNTYTYTVRAYREVPGGYAGGPLPAGVSVKVNLNIAIPTMVGSYALGNEVHLKWKALSGVDGYRIGRLQNGKWTTVAYSKSTTYVDTTATQVYNYRVQGYKLVNGTKVFGSNVVAKPKKFTKIYMVGHSRGLGMKSAVGTKVKAPTEWLCKVSAGYRQLSQEYMPSLAGKLNSGTAVVIMMGVNDLYQKANYVKYLNANAAAWKSTGASVFFVGVGPVEHDPYCDNNEIREFNTYMKTNLKGVTYVDTYDFLIKNGYSTWDGAHYTNAVYVNQYGHIMNNLF